jgi:hypothetical protein
VISPRRSDRPTYVLVGAADGAHPVARALRAAGARIRFCDAAAELEGVPGTIAAIIAALPRLQGYVGLLRALDAAHPRTPLVLITERSAANLRRLAGVRASAVLFDRELTLLPAVLRDVAREHGFARWAAATRQAGVSGPVRAALLHLFQFPIAAPDAGPDSAAPAPVSADELAALVRCAPATLRSQARAHGIDLDRAAGAILCLHAVCLRSRGGSWREAGRRLGFASEQALADAMRRHLGRDPDAADARRSEVWELLLAPVPPGFPAPGVPALR